MILDTVRNAFSLSRMSDRDRRAITLGALVLLPGLLYVVAVKPYFALLAETKDRTAAERRLLARELDLIAQKTSLPATLVQARRKAELAELSLVQAQNPTMAEAELTELLEKVAGLSRVLLKEVRSVPTPRGHVDPEGVQTVRLAVRGESDLEGVLKYLKRIEESTTTLKVHELSLEPAPPQRAEPAQRGRPPRRPLNADAGVLQFTIVVEAFAPAATTTPAESP
jgi:hypothetical protein